MASIEFIISANYKKVEEAYAKIDDLKKLVESFKSDSPQGISLIGDINQEQKKIEALVEEIRKLKEEQAQQSLKAIEDSKKQAQELQVLAQKYNDLHKQMNAAPVQTSSKPTELISTSPEQSQTTSTTNFQVMALEELDRSIVKVNGSLDNNITRLLRERAALDEVKKRLSDLNKEEKASGKASEEQKKLRTELTKAELEHKQSISSLRRVVENDIKLNQAAIGSMDQMSQALGRMKSVYRSLNAEERSSSFGKSLLDAIQKLDPEIKKLDATIGNHQRNVGNYSSALDNLSSAMDGALDAASLLPGPIGSAASSIKGLTKASLAFIATPIGAVIAGVVAALALMSSWFNRTEEGQNALNVSSAYFKQTLDSILDVVDDLGEWLYNAFTKPKEALQDLSDFLEDQIMVRLKSFAKMGESIMKIFSGDFKEGASEFGSAWLEQITGIENAGEKAMKFIDETTDKAKKRADLAERENKLAIEQRAWLVERSKLEARINELREKSQDSSLTEKERLKASKEASSLINQMYEKEQELAVENRDIIAETNKLSHSNAEAKDKEAKATAEINKLDAERASKNRELLSQQKEINNRIVEGQKKLDQSVINDQIKLNAERLALMEEGRKKRLALSEQEWKERKAQLDKEYQDTVEQYKKIGQEVPKEVQTTYQARVEINDQSRDKRDKEINKEADREFADRQKALTNVLLSEEAKRTQAIKERYDKEREWAEKQLKSGDMDQEQYNKYIATVNVAEEKENLSSLLKDYATFQQNREKITAEYNEKIRKMNEANAKAAEKGEEQVFSVGNFEEAERQLQEAYDNLDSVLAQRDEDFKVLAATISSKTTTELSKLINDADQQLKLLSPTNDKDAESMAVLRARIKVLQEQLNTARAKEKADDENKLLKWKKQVKALEDVKSATDDIIDSFDGLDESTKNILSAVSTVAGATISAIGTMTTLVDNAGNSMSLTAYMASKSISTVEKASVILTIISAALQVAMAIANLFNKDNKRQEEIERLQDQIDALQKAYDKLDKAIEKAYSNDASKLIDQQNKLLEQQKVLIRQQIREEEDKKKTDKDKLKDYQDQLDEIDEKIADNKVKAQDAIFGDDVQGAIDDFADAYLEAWEAGEDKAKSMKDVVKKMIKGVVTEMIKADLAPTIQGLRDKIQYMLTDGIIDDFEQAELDKIIEEESKKAENKYGWADKYIKEQEDAKRSAQAKGMAAMSQDTGDKLDGKFTAGLIYLDKMTTSSYDIAGSIKELTRQSYDGWKNVEAIRDISRNIEVLNIRIADNTEDIGTILKSINKNTNSSNENLEYMRTNGLYVKR